MSDLVRFDLNIPNLDRFDRILGDPIRVSIHLKEDGMFFIGKGFDKVVVHDLARSLSRQNRYAGHGVETISVLQHTINVTKFAHFIGEVVNKKIYYNRSMRGERGTPPYLDLKDLSLRALTHDAFEGVFQDVIYPIRQPIPNLELVDKLGGIYMQETFGLFKIEATRSQGLANEIVNLVDRWIYNFEMWRIGFYNYDDNRIKQIVLEFETSLIECLNKSEFVDFDFSKSICDLIEIDFQEVADGFSYIPNELSKRRLHVKACYPSRTIQSTISLESNEHSGHVASNWMRLISGVYDENNGIKMYRTGEFQ